MSMMDSFNELEPKQKGMLVVTILLIGFVVYMGYDTFFPDGFGGGNSAAVAKTPPKPEPDQTALNEESFSIPTTPEKPTLSEEKTTELTPEQLALLAESQELQRQYLRMVNEYQLYQMQQKVENAKALVAAAELKIQQIQAQKAAFEHQERLKNEAENIQPGVGDLVPTLKVVFVSKRMGEWMAVLKGDDDAFFQVKDGTRLPDGSKVDVINEKGVVMLSSNGTKSFIAMPKAIN